MVDPTGFPNGLSVRYERGVKDDIKVSGKGKLEA